MATSSWGSPRSSPGDDRGSATLEVAVLFPVVLLLIFGILQGSLWYHARNVALAAATQGVQTTRAASGTTASGQADATQFVSSAGGTDVLTGLSVSGSRTPTNASITVTGRSISVLPGIPGPTVSQTAAGPVERFTSGVTP